MRSEVWVKLLIHSQTSIVAPLGFGNGYMSASHILLWMWLFIRQIMKRLLGYLEKTGRVITKLGKISHYDTGRTHLLVSGKSYKWYILHKGSCSLSIYTQDRRWNADKPSAALDPYIPTGLTTSPANHRPANFWIFFLNIGRKLWKVVQSQVELMKTNLKFEAPILWFFKYK